jgi:hypothetical protein
MDAQQLVELASAAAQHQQQLEHDHKETENLVQMEEEQKNELEGEVHDAQSGKDEGVAGGVAKRKRAPGVSPTVTPAEAEEAAPHSKEKKFKGRRVSGRFWKDTIRQPVRVFCRVSVL